ncbi:MAG: molybdopterin-dependent oxidoreductase [Phycisphaeraceae bacterium]|nr:molybdopterin-dependent oxidoreductase [Phycisphaeraceae bacterium]
MDHASDRPELPPRTTSRPLSTAGPPLPPLSRRQFLFSLMAAGASTTLLSRHAMAAVAALAPVSVDNPFDQYPARDWEKVYRDLYHSDSTFTFLCAPNDTHNCLLNAHVKNGVVTRISPTYKFHLAEDLDGRRASQRWEPRVCQKGLALVRRFYGDRRCKKPMIRKGFKQWVDDGMPRDPKTGAVDADKYLRRGFDAWEAVTWDEALAYSAKAMTDIARTYSGEEGQQKLLAQGYDPLMVQTTQGAGTQVLKFRGGMAALGITRIFAQYRIANAMALLDDKLRGTGPDKALGARGWDNYSWHTDLPPGHPMVTGQQTVDFDLCNVEYAKLILVWGMNWICTKMPDAHWLTEARMKGAKVVVIACEYSATTCKADEALVVRPGTTPALALGIAQTLIAEKLYDAAWIAANTDLPCLVRMDTGQMLRAAEVWSDRAQAASDNGLTVLKTGQKPPLPHQQAEAVVAQARRDDWGDFVVWDAKQAKPTAIGRGQVGAFFAEIGVEPALAGAVTVRLADGRTVECRTVFDVTRQMLDASYTPEQVEKLTWAPAAAIRSLARQIAANPQQTLFCMGMGPNQFFNNDLKDRAVFLVAALTRNVGFPGGNVGSFAGNYRGAFLNGVVNYMAENPFRVQTDPDGPAEVRRYWQPESVHYFNHGEHILRMGKTVLTGKTHLPTPTKSIHVSNSNSLLGNVKGHYDLVFNTLRRVEFVAINEWWWTTSCEYADVVFPVDSWAEMKYPDLTISVTNPFLYLFPATPLPRIHDTRSDLEVAAGLCEAIGRHTGDDRHAAYWKFVREGQARPYLQRILDGSNATRGYRIQEIEAKAAEGIPVILQTRTYPKYVGMEQSQESRPWYTRTGRLEFYRDEPEFMDSGENLVLHREPIDSTFYEPNVIVAAAHPLLRPKSPEDYGVSRDDLRGDVRQARHVIKTVEELLATRHPLNQYGYQFIFHTPKYRHGAHTTPTDLDIIAVWFGPFGDMRREDRRMPGVSEMYVDIHPRDAKSLGIEDGDYVWIDADPHDRPFRGWQDKPELYKVARLLARARYYPGTPPGVTRMWHNAYAATYSSVMAALNSPIGLAKSQETGYQALFRSGCHQSCTRGYIKPTMMTDSLNVKEMLSQVITQGFVPDVHCPTGAPREAMVRITRAEAGGLDGKGLWRPAQIGLRPTYENNTLKTFIAGGFVQR